MKISDIECPFVRKNEAEASIEKFWSFDHLIKFEEYLSDIRKEYPAVGNELRKISRGGPRWVKLRNEEILPIYYYFKHIGAPKNAQFRLLSENNRVDAEIEINGSLKTIQITLAIPDWPRAGLSYRGDNAGAYYSRRIRLLNQTGQAGIGPISENDELLSQDATAVNDDQVKTAYIPAITDAINIKNQKNFLVKADNLIIYVIDFEKWLGCHVFEQIISEIKAFYAHLEPKNFKEIHLFGCNPESHLILRDY
jgi:hypothetical protein